MYLFKFKQSSWHRIKESSWDLRVLIIDLTLAGWVLLLFELTTIWSVAQWATRASWISCSPDTCWSFLRFLYHVTRGRGTPMAGHCRVTELLMFTLQSLRFCNSIGASRTTGRYKKSHLCKLKGHIPSTSISSNSMTSLERRWWCQAFCIFLSLGV